MDKVDSQFLLSHSLFGGLTAEEIEHVIPLLREEHHQTGETVIREGSIGDRLYFIQTGSVEIVKRCNVSSGNEERQIAVLNAGDTFGEMELIDIQPSPASVKTLEETELLTLTNRCLYQIYKDNMKCFTIIIMNLARELSRRLRRMDAIVAGISTLDCS